MKISHSLFLAAALAFAAAPADAAPGSSAPGMRYEKPADAFSTSIRRQIPNPSLPVPAALAPRAPRRAADAMVNIPARGAIVFSDDQYTNIGFYEIPTAGDTDLFTAVSYTEYCLGNAGMLYFDDTVMVLSAEVDQYTGRSVSYYTLDADTYELKGMGVVNDNNFKAFSMAQDPVSGTCYGSFRNEASGASYFGSFDPSAVKATRIKAYTDPLNFNALSFTTDGNLYGITFDGSFYAIDKATGDAALIASTGIVSEYSSSGAINPRNNLFYYVTCCDSGSAMYEIVPGTGAVTKVYGIADNDEILGLYFGVAHMADGVPDYPQELAAEFSGADLTGEVTFTMPSTLLSGAQAEGEGTYILSINDKQYASAKAPFGTKVTVPVTVGYSSQFTISVAVANEAGTGPAAIIKHYIGEDMPMEVTSLHLSYYDGTATLTWAPARPMMGGYLENLHYKVYRRTGQELMDLVADDCTDCTFSEHIDAPTEGLTSLSYSVVACTTNFSSEPVESNHITLGTVTPPYSNDMSTEELASHLTAINHNDDRYTWEWDKRGYFGCYYNPAHEAPDDFLMLPGVHLEGGKIYTFSFEAFGFETSRYTERVAAYVGTAPRADALTTCIVEPVEIEGGERRLLTGNFKAYNDGIFYFAIHCCSDADNFVLYADNISVSAPLEFTAPGAVTNLKATPHINGALETVISFNAPKVDLNGDPLPEITAIDIYSGDRHVAHISDDLAPGKALTYTDAGASEGENTYTVVASNDSGTGETATTSCFVGFAAPARPEWLRLAPGDNFGAVRLTWAPVTTDVNGLQFNPGDVSYIVALYIDNSPEIIAEGVTECTYEHQAYEAEADQEMLQYAVFPVNRKGQDGVGITEEMIPAGAPYKLPFTESFPGGYMSHAFGMTYDGAQWWLGTDNDFKGKLAAQDGDNGFAVFGSNDLATSSRLLSARIDLTGASEPELSFWHYSFGDYDKNTLTIYVNDDTNGWQPLGEPLVLGSGNAGEWNQVTLPLTAYAGHHIRLCFDGAINTVAYSFIDNVMVADHSGITDPFAEPSAPSLTCAPEYYTIQGIRLHSRPTAPGIYIVRRGSLSSKLLIR